MTGERRSNRDRIAAGILLSLFGTILVTSAAQQFRTLAGAYRAQDLLLTQTPDTFKVWLSELTHQEDIPSIAKAASIADRLAAMPHALRRRVIINMARSDFWSDIEPLGASQRVTKQRVLEGILLALRGEPAAGDLYFAAAWLEASLNGYTIRAQHLLAASRTLAPHEFDLAVERLILSATVWESMAVAERLQSKDDFDVVVEARPREASAIVAELARDGIRFE